MTDIDYELIRVLAASTMFAIAVFFDLKGREVRDMLWIIFGAVAAAIFLLDFSSTLDNAINISVSIAFASAISYGIYRSGLFGGADMLALITFAGVIPLFDGSFAGLEGKVIHQLAPIIVLTNAVILSVSGVIFNTARNIIRYSRNHRTFFSGLEHKAANSRSFSQRLVVSGHWGNVAHQGL